MGKGTAWNSTLRPGKPPVRKKRPNPVNPKRRRRMFERNFGEKAKFIRSKPCEATGLTGGTVAAHVKSRGAGGTSEDLFPLHWNVHLYLHQHGWEMFEAKYGLSKEGAIEAAARYEAEWREQNIDGQA